MGAVALYCISPAIRIMQHWSQQFIEWSSHSLTIKTTIIRCCCFFLRLLCASVRFFVSFSLLLFIRTIFSVDRFHVFFFLLDIVNQAAQKSWKWKEKKKISPFFPFIFCVIHVVVASLLLPLNVQCRLLETGSLFYATYFDWTKSS